MKPKAAFQYEQMVHDKVGMIPSGPSPPPIPPPPIPPPPVSLVGLPVSYADQEDGGDGGDYLDDQNLDGFVIVNPEDLYEGDFQAPDPESGYQRADHVILDQEFKPYSRPEMSKPDSSLFSLPVEVAKPELPFASRSFSPETSKYEPPTRPEATKSKPDIESFDGIRPYEVFSKKLDKSENTYWRLIKGKISVEFDTRSMREIRENDSKSRIFVKGKKQMMLLTVYIHVDAE